MCEPTEIPFVRTISNKVYVFRKQEVEVIDIASLERNVMVSEVEEVVAVEGCEKGVLVLGVWNKGKDKGLAYFRDGIEVGRYALKKMPLSVRYIGKGRVAVGG